MTNEQSIFAAALEIANAADRDAFLTETCAGDESLRAHIERLLAADQQAGGILERGPAASLDSQRPASALAAGALFAGRFRLRQKLGEGGMGEVWDAEQTDPVQRRVALKVVRPGLDSRPLLARFGQERQALALMDHPNIARVLDAGVAHDAPDGPGRPFFVMEFIEGVSITQYCDAARLSPRERLELLVPVCQAVQHAHQKGIIHRDLKPSNILVGLYDGRPVPKVIDFGVAKATGPRLTEVDVVTEVGSLIGTVEYMSPEQAELDNLDIDTRADVYALGAILYELLTGTVPFSRRELQSVALAEVLRKIREDEPPRPSTKLSDFGALASVAAARHTEPKKLIALLRGELDWIVAKCLEKDRRRRYETANGLAIDLQRYLADEAVSARPPSTGYRLRKFVSRNRGPVLAVTLVVLALVGGIVGTTAALVEARRQRDAAGAAEKLASDRLAQVESEKQRADDERGVALALNDFFLRDLLGQAYAGNQSAGGDFRDLNPNITVRDVLDRANSLIAGKFTDRPLVEAAVRITLANTYQAIGEYQLAIPHAERALRLREAHLPTDHTDVLDAKLHLGRVYSLASRPKEGIELLEHVRDERTRRDGPDELATAAAQFELADAYARTGRRDDAISLAEKVYAVRAERLPHDHVDYLNVLVMLGQMYRLADRGKEAIDLLEQAKTLGLERFPPDHPGNLSILEALGRTYLETGRTKDAVRLLEMARDGRTRVQTADHPRTLIAARRLARAYLADGRTADGLRLYQQVVDVQKSRLTVGHIETLITMDELARAFKAAGQWADVIRVHQESLAATSKRYGPGHGQTLAGHLHLGEAYRDAGQLEPAVAEFRTAAEGIERSRFDIPLKLEYFASLADVYEQRKEFKLAEPWRHKAVELAREKFGPRSIEHADCQAALAEDLSGQALWGDAVALLKGALAVQQAERPTDWRTFDAMSLLGHALAGQKDFQQAESHLLNGYNGLKDQESKLSPQQKVRVVYAIERLVQLYEAWGKPTEAEKWRAARAARPGTEK